MAPRSDVISRRYRQSAHRPARPRSRSKSFTTTNRISAVPFFGNRRSACLLTASSNMQPSYSVLHLILALQRLAPLEFAVIWSCCCSGLYVGPHCLRGHVRYHSSAATKELQSDGHNDRHWHCHQQSCGNQLSDNMRGKLRSRSFGYANRDGGLGIPVLRIQWRVQRHLLSDHALQ